MSQRKDATNALEKLVKNTLLDELRRVNRIKGQTGKGKRSLTAVTGRSKIVEALKDCPVGRWIELTDFFRYIIAAAMSLRSAVILRA